MKIILFLCLFAGSLAFHAVKKVPPMILDTSFLKSTGGAKTASFAQLKTLMTQARDTAYVSNFLDSLLEDVATRRQQRLAIIQQSRAACAEEREFRAGAIAEGLASAAASQSQLALCSSQKDTATHLNELADSALQVYQNHLQELAASRQESKAAHESELEQLDNFDNSLKTLNNLLDAYEAAGNSPLESSFIQNTNKLLKISVRTGHSALVLPIYHKLIQMHSKQAVNEEALSNIRALITELNKASAENRALVNSDEQQEQADFEAASASLTALIQKLNSQLAFTGAFKATMDQCLAQENSILVLSNDKAARNQAILDNSELVCSNSEEEWRLSEVSRGNEVKLINALLSAIARLEQEFEVQELPSVGDVVDVSLLQSKQK